MDQKATGTGKGDGHEQHDDDLDELQSNFGTPASNTEKIHPYIPWLRLLVSHIDGVEILTQHVTKETFQYSSIEIDIVVAAKTDSRMLPWHDLFKDSTYIMQGLSPISSLMIKEEINNRLAKLTTSTFMASFDKLWKANAASDLKHKVFAQPLSQLIKSTNPDIASLADDIKSLIAPDKRGMDMRQQINEKMLDMHRLLGDTQQPADHFIRSLETANEFKGTLHCEIFLASILAAAHGTSAFAANNAGSNTQLDSVRNALNVRYHLSSCFCYLIFIFIFLY